MGRPSNKILELRKAAYARRITFAIQNTDGYLVTGGMGTEQSTVAAALAAEFGVTYEVALHQVKRVHYQLTHDGKAPHRGQPNDTALRLGPARCAWLKAHGGKQPVVKRLVDEAMTQDAEAAELERERAHFQRQVDAVAALLNKAMTNEVS